MDVVSGGVIFGGLWLPRLVVSSLSLRLAGGGRGLGRRTLRWSQAYRLACCWAVVSRRLPEEDWSWCRCRSKSGTSAQTARCRAPGLAQEQLVLTPKRWRAAYRLSAYRSDAVLRKPDFNEPTATAWSGGRRAGGPIDPDEGTRPPRRGRSAGGKISRPTCFARGSNHLDLVLCSLVCVLKLAACSPASPMTTGNTGHQAPTTGAGTSPGLGCRSLGRPLCQRWQGPDLIAQAGAGPELDAYLQARNIHRTATLAVMGADLDQFKKAVVAPWAAGYTDSAPQAAGHGGRGRE